MSGASLDITAKLGLDYGIKFIVILLSVKNPAHKAGF
jgi:hypothetical protein